jgi:hypothetical protein
VNVIDHIKTFKADKRRERLVAEFRAERLFSESVESYLEHLRNVASKNKEATLKLYLEIANSIASSDNPNSYESVAAVRDRYTSWAPSVISLPIWLYAHKALREGRGTEFLSTLEQTILEIQGVLAHRSGHVSTTLFGDLSNDIAVFASSRSS